MSENTQAIYTSNCISGESINNPLVGHNVYMQVSGFFNSVSKSIGKAYPDDDIHVGWGGIEKTTNNGAAIFCKDASKLFSTASGGLSIRICLPDHDIVGGVYQGLLKTKRTIEDHIIWGVNVGEHYISQPGIYTAFTKNGIEFTIWTSRGIETLIEDRVNVIAGNDLILDFTWENNGIPDDPTNNMRIFANGNTVGKKASLSNNSFQDAGGSGSPASFWLLDTPYKKSDLHSIIRRIEVYSMTVVTPRPNPNSEKILKSGISSFKFDITASQGASVEIKQPEFHRVSIKTVDMKAIGPISSSSHKNGEDLGRENQTVKAPELLLDLPPGFIETREMNYE